MAAYLVAGEVELSGAGGRRTLIAGTDPARYALSNAPSYPDTAIASTAVDVLFVDRERLDLALTWEQAATCESAAQRSAGSIDWMASMLRNPALHRVPAANIPRIVAAVERVEFAVDETIIRQGAPGDYYYVLTKGRCLVRRRGADGVDREIDRMAPGRGFGEEALVSGDPRNATVSTLTACELVRLAAHDFNRFLREPLVRSATLQNAPLNAQWVDVRLEEEFAGGHLPDAHSVPLQDLRARCRDLDPTRPLVVYCDGGRRSASATFLFSERGFNAYWLAGGVPSDRLTLRG
jgi:rhodanese-related sulfurtransferase